MVKDEDGIEGGKGHNGHVPVGSAEHGVNIVVERLKRVILRCICCPTFIAEEGIVVVVGEEIVESLLILNHVIHEILLNGGVVGWGTRILAYGGSSCAGPVSPWGNVEEDAWIWWLEVVSEERVGDDLRPCWPSNINLW